MIRNFIFKRGMKELNFGGTNERVYERADYPASKLASILGKDTLAVLGYGTQGRGQALNMRDNLKKVQAAGGQTKVVLGLRKGASWDLALKDGWVPKKDLLELDEACEKSTVIMNLLSDAAQTTLWPQVNKHLQSGKKTLYFSHGFSVVYKDQTKVIPAKNMDVILVAPKGSGTTLRSLFLEGRGVNASVAVFQDVSGKALERALAIGTTVGAGYMYETTFQKEVYSDLTGERGVLMGAIYGLFKAQYEVLRERGHSPSEAFNETVEEATQSLYPLVGAKGMDWMYDNCSTTARRGALDWYPKFYKANKPLFNELYDEVINGNETKRSLEFNSQTDYRDQFEKELKEIREHEMWKAGETVRQLRPENADKE